MVPLASNRHMAALPMFSPAYYEPNRYQAWPRRNFRHTVMLGSVFATVTLRWARARDAERRTRVSERVPIIETVWGSQDEEGIMVEEDK